MYVKATLRACERHVKLCALLSRPAATLVAIADHGRVPRLRARRIASGRVFWPWWFPPFDVLSASLCNTRTKESDYLLFFNERITSGRLMPAPRRVGEQQATLDGMAPRGKPRHHDSQTRMAGA